MSQLTEIEKEYCRNIVKFFCREYDSMLKVSSEVIHRVSDQIENRLLSTRLIRDYKVTVDPESTKADRRNCVICNVLEDAEIPKYKILVHLRFNDLTFETIQYTYEKEKIEN